MIRLIKNEFVKNFALIRGLVFLAVFFIFAYFIIGSSFQYAQKSNIMSDSNGAHEYLARLEQKYKNNPTNDNLYNVNVATLNAELENVTNNITMYEQGWQLTIMNEILVRNNTLAALKMSKDGIKADSFQYGLVYKNDTEEEINSNYDELFSINEKQINLLKTDSYYEYLKIEINQLQEQNRALKDGELEILQNNDLIKIKQYMVDQKIKYDNDVRVDAQKKLEHMVSLKTYHVLSEDEFDKSNQIKFNYKTYENYLEQTNATNNFIKKENIRLWYALENSVELSNGTKDAMIDFYQIMVFIMLGTVISYAAIISKEFKSGSIRLLLTQGPKRYKILLSKYIMMILSSYILYYACYIVYFLLVLSKGSISDFTPQLVMFLNTPFTINYFLYIFVETLIYGLPLVFIMTLVFLITIITNSSILGSIIGVILSVVSLFSVTIVYFFDVLKLYFLKYIPFSYLNLYVCNPNFTDYFSASFIFNTTIGALVLIVSIIVMYLVAHFIFTKRDVRN